MCLPYHQIYICRANPRTPGQDFSSPPNFYFAQVCLWVSGGLLFPLQAQCRLWAAEQYRVQRAWEKILHAAIFASYYARELLLTVFLSKSDSRLDGRKNIERVHGALPNYINKMAPERKYAMNHNPCGYRGGLFVYLFFVF